MPLVMGPSTGSMSLPIFLGRVDGFDDDEAKSKGDERPVVGPFSRNGARYA